VSVAASLQHSLRFLVRSRAALHLENHRAHLDTGDSPISLPSLDGSALVHQLFELERMTNRMHDRVLEHRVDTVPRLPSGRILRRLEPIIADVPERRSPFLQHVLHVAVGFCGTGGRLRWYADLRIR